MENSTTYIFRTHIKSVQNLVKGIGV